MIKVSAFYPFSDSKSFAWDYYLDKHMPMVITRFGAACLKIEVEKGLAGPVAGSNPTYLAVANMYFDSVEAFQNAFGPVAAEILGDIPNYTAIEPQIQISQIM